MVPDTFLSYEKGERRQENGDRRKERQGMKLQDKINIRFLLITLVVFTVAGVLFYFALGKVIDQNIREMLDSRKTNVILYLQHRHPDSIPLVSPDRSIFIRSISPTKNFTRIADTLVYDVEERGLIPYRKMVFTTSTEKYCFEVTLLQSLLELVDLQAVIISFMIFLFVLILSALFLLNRWLSNKAWKPFFRSSSLLKTWKLNESKPIQFEKTGISEFDQLNMTLQEMIEKMQADFVNLREFTENASHEIQTPLAIIKSKLEMMLNDPALSSAQHAQLHEIFETVNRLSKMNEVLLLLSKIENRQFIEKSEINFSRLIESRLVDLEELLEMKQIKLSLNLTAPFVVPIHSALADILINNLLSNALKYSHIQGEIFISSEHDKIVFSNTGEPLTIDPKNIFKRFVKQNNSVASNGLGLAIADEICKSNQLTLAYTYQNGLHSFVLGKK
jgi:signal transduction histidine kinase